MEFKLDEFMRTAFKPRQEKVFLPDLAAWFSGDGAPAWEVRGLTAHELAKCDEIVGSLKMVNSIAQALVVSNDHERVKKLRDALGLGESTPKELAKRIEQFVVASVSPKIDHAAAVKFATVFPVEFYQLTNKILELTGKGGEAEVKPQPSGNVQTSE